MADPLPLPRRGFLVLAVLATTPALAQTPDTGAVEAPIRAFYAALEAQMRMGQAVPFRQRFDTLAPVIERVFNIDSILRVSIGPRWNSLDDTSRAALQQAFRRFTIASYVAGFGRYDGQKFEIQADARPSGADFIVPTRIVAANGDVTRIDYLMHNDGAGWRVADILLDGTISRVAVQRSDFRRLLASGGASALIDSLRRKTADLSGGSLNS